MASAPPVRAEPWTPPLPAKPALPPSAPPPSAQPAPPLPFHLWRRRQQRRVRSAFSAASGARKQWDAASADGLRAATAVVNRLVQLKQLPGKDLGAVGGMEGIVERAAEKIRRIMEEDLCTLRRCLNDLAAAVDALVPALLPIYPPPHIPPPLHAPDTTAHPPAAPESTVAPFTFATSLAAPVPLSAVSAPAPAAAAAAPSPFRASAASVSPSPSAGVWDAYEVWQEAWQERDMYPDEPIFTALRLSVFERWAGDVAAMFRRELLVKRLILSSLNSAVRHEAATTTTARTTTTTPNTSLTSQSPLKHPLNIPPLCLPCAASPPATVPAPKADATLDASALAVEEGASPGETVETGGGRLEAAGAAGTTGAGRAATSRDEDGRETPAATEEEAASEAAAEGEAPGCLQGEGIGTGGGDMETGIGGERGAGGNGGRGQGGSGMLEGQNGLKGQAWAEGRGLSHGLSAAEGCEWAVVQQQLEQSGLLARSPTPQQLQVCLVAWLVEMHIDSRCLSFIFAAVDEEVKSVAA
ncbi:unnamed protein product [Closterium sp. NIES-64]|nr:unnamed protein product [Closterium sp. NIES-64]